MMTLPLLLAWLPLWAGTASEPPHLELIQGLRQRGDAEWALDYLDFLETRSVPLPDAVRRDLPQWRLQLRVDVALAARELDALDRNVQAILGDLERLGSDRARLQVDEARLHSEYGELLALLALELRVPALRLQLSAAARRQLEAAANHWRALAKDAGPDQAATAAIGLGQTLLLQSRLLDADDRKAGEQWQEAERALSRVAEQSPPTPAAYLAQAWLVRAWTGVDERKADEVFRKLLQERRTEAQQAQRLARFFRLGETWRRRLEPGRYNKTLFRTEAERWLAEAHRDARPFDAIYLRFCLATSFGDDFLAQEDAGRAASTVKSLLDRALAEYDAVQRGVGPFAQLADERRLALLTRSGRGEGPIEAVATASECLLQARLAWTKMAEDEQRLATLPERERPEMQQHIRAHAARADAAVQRGLSLVAGKEADEWLPLQRLRLDLAQRRQDWPAAITVCTEVWEAAPDQALRQNAAIEALRLMVRLPDRGGASRIELARRVIQREPQSLAADFAREIIGLDHFESARYAEAAAILGEVGDRYPRQPHCRYFAALAHWQAHTAACREAERPYTTASKELETTRAWLPEALARLEALESDRTTAAAARLDLAQIQLALDQPAEASATLAPLLERLEKSDKPPFPAALAGRVLETALRAALMRQDGGQAALSVLALMQKQGMSTTGFDDLLQELGRQLRQQLEDLERQGPTADPQLAKLKQTLESFVGQVEKSPSPSVEVRQWLASMHLSLGRPARAAELYLALLAEHTGGGMDEARKQGLRLQALIACRQAAEASGGGERQSWLTKARERMRELVADPRAARSPLVVRENILLAQLGGQYVAAIEQWEGLRASLEPHLVDRPDLAEIYHEAAYHQFRAMCGAAAAVTEAEPRRLARQRAAQTYLLIERRGFGTPAWKTRFEAFLRTPEQRDIHEAVQQMREDLP
ncbi:MAG TPA: hypothetical protein PKD86_04555 [Gemmatales bacterium]|nr:hypothetical protein [Gemmatales bacterium]